jgi:hypothetical protein
MSEAQSKIEVTPRTKIQVRKSAAPDTSPTTLSPSEAAQYLAEVLAPAMGEIVEARTESDGIVLLVVRPDSRLRKAVKGMGLGKIGADTTVMALTPAAAAKALGSDPITKEWCATPPTDDEIKVLVLSRTGSLLLTLQDRIEPDGKHVTIIDAVPDADCLN